MTKDEALREAIDTLKSTKHGNCDFAWIDETLKKCTEALAKPALEPVAMRMPKVGDKVICLEDKSLGKVVSLTAGGSPDIKFDDGSHGTYLLREFAELFGYVNSAQQQAEPVTWDKPSASFNDWWDGDYEDPANPFEKDSAAWWAWAGWKAAQSVQEPVAYLCENGVGHRYFRWKKPSDIYKPISLYTAPPQREWVGLTDEEMSDIVADIDVDFGDLLWKVVCLTKIIEATLKERNK